MNQIDIWQMEDAIRTAVESYRGCGIHALTYNRDGSCFHIELTSHLSEEEASTLCAQLPLSGYYNGEGQYGSIFELQA